MKGRAEGEHPHANGKLSAQAHAPLPAAGAQRKDARRATKPKSRGELAPDPSQCRAGAQPVRNSRFRRARTRTIAAAKSAHRGDAPMRLREFSRAALNCRARSEALCCKGSAGGRWRKRCGLSRPGGSAGAALGAVALPNLEETVRLEKARRARVRPWLCLSPIHCGRSRHWHFSGQKALS